MKFRFVLWVVLVMLTAYGLFTAESFFMQRSLAEKTVRLHVVANSDSEADQAQKLRVRDAVLREVAALTKNCTDAVQARAVIGQNLGVIEASAQRVLTDEGSSYPVSVSLGTEDFDTRYYETFTLPAGKYPALRVRIGAAEGKNWWCVVFPSLCTAATTDAVEEYAAVGGFDETETDFITGGEEKYELRFKTLEWLKELFSWLN